MKIKVTQDDIDNGERHRCYRCPIAHAMCRTLGASIAVTQEKYYREEDDGKYLPTEAQRFILDFDAGRPVAPFEFEVEA